MSTTSTRRIHAAVAAVLLVLSWAAAGAGSEPRELSWDDLMPPDWNPFAPMEDLAPGSLDQIEEGSEEDRRLMQQLQEARSSAPVVEALNGQNVRLPGYIVPLDFEGTEVTEFLLVPYFGACIHVPPPPSNQIVYVKTVGPYPIDGMFAPVWVTGTLRTEAFLNLLGDAGYTRKATLVEPYE